MAPPSGAVEGVTLIICFTVIVVAWIHSGQLDPRAEWYKTEKMEAEANAAKMNTDNEQLIRQLMEKVDGLQDDLRLAMAAKGKATGGDGIVEKEQLQAMERDLEAVKEGISQTRSEIVELRRKVEGVRDDIRGALRMAKEKPVRRRESGSVGSEEGGSTLGEDLFI